MITCYETQIGEIENGLLVKIGCKTFFSTPEELKNLAVYYGDKKLPDVVKDFARAGEAFMRGDDTPREGPSLSGCSRNREIPSFFKKKTPEIQIYKITNGFVVETERGLFGVPHSNGSILQIFTNFLISKEDVPYDDPAEHIYTSDDLLEDVPCEDPAENEYPPEDDCPKEACSSPTGWIAGVCGKIDHHPV